jgi:hypothetical protein
MTNSQSSTPKSRTFFVSKKQRSKTSLCTKAIVLFLYSNVQPRTLPATVLAQLAAAMFYLVHTQNQFFSFTAPADFLLLQQLNEASRGQ